LIDSTIFTFREAVSGFLIGTFFALGLGTLLAHSSLFERGLVPYVVASQTAPILAIAPMVIIWLKAGWVSVAVISAYVAFFTVTIKSWPCKILILMRAQASLFHLLGHQGAASRPYYDRLQT
jgi:NitT/TauT family transport system permease protein